VLRAESVRAAAEQIFAAAKPIERGDLVDLYLRRRGISLGQYPAALRLHPGLRHAETQSTWPCLVTRITTGGGRFMAVHRTFLDGTTATKAPVAPPRKSLGPLSGGAARLFDPAGSALLIAEGIETALACLVLSGWRYAGWAAISTAGMVALQIPGRFRTVKIAADHDYSGAGIRAARKLAKRLRAAGHHVDIKAPPRPGDDWADVLLSRHIQHIVSGGIA
jgi:putative DNA primase/helicase